METRQLGLGITPTGRIRMAREVPFARELPLRVATGIEQAFEAGEGPGLLHLGTERVSDDLGPTIGFWREIAKLFLTKACSVLDIDTAVRTGLALPLETADESALLAEAPPMFGGEYLSPDALRHAWDSLARAFEAEVAASGKGAEAYLKTSHPLWSTVGRIFFHLAENKSRPDLPFAFLATYTSRISAHGKVQHVPLGRAVGERAGAGDREKLLSLLVPVQKSGERSPFLKELADSGRLFQPQSWTPDEAHRFLRDVPIFEECGIYVRVPDWWNPRSAPRIRVGVTVGKSPAAGLGVEALLDFSVGLTLEGEPIDAAEWRRILESTGSLALVKGRWVEVDREKLAGLLRRWKKVERETDAKGVSFLEGMRLLAGFGGGATAKFADSSSLPSAGAPIDAEWTSLAAGEWLRGVLAELRDPEAADALPGESLKTALRPYQEKGVRWLGLLRKLRLGGCLADDMGLGKTIQVLALLLLMKRDEAKDAKRRASLLVIPASLIANWKSECERFAPSLRLFVAHPSEPGGVDGPAPADLAECDLVITTYGMLQRLAWIRETSWAMVILDEAQAIKNANTRQTLAAKALRSQNRLALTGTPIENRLDDLWSLFDFLMPGLLGDAGGFSKLAKAAEKDGVDVFARIRSIVHPYILRRMKTDKRIIADLPDKEEVKVHCGLRKVQAVLYKQAVDALAESLRGATGMRRRGTILAFLTRFKQICNHPSQWTGDGAYDAADSGKMARLQELCEEIASRQEKALIFTQFREITEALARLLEGVFHRPGVVLDGTTPVKKRREIVEEFQREDGPPFFVLSLKAGGTGLNLTAASHVIHFDRWWNPAVENQATDRAFRIGQKKNVLVHKFLCQGTVEERIDAMLESKRALSEEILRGGAEAALTEMSDDDLMRLVTIDTRRAVIEGA